MANKRILPAEQERQFLEDAAELLASGLFMGDIEQLQNAENIEQELLPILKQITQEVQKPITGREYSSKLIPGSPDFDFSAYKRAIKAAGGFDALLTEALAKPVKSLYKEALTANLKKLGAVMSEYAIDGKGMLEGIKSFSDAAKDILSGIKAFFASDEYKAFKETTEAIGEYYAQNKEALKELADTREDLQSLAFFIQSEQETDPDFSTTPLKEILTAGLDEQGQPTDSKYRPLIERALQRQAEFIAELEPVKEIEQAAKELPRIIETPINEIDITVDIVDHFIWNFITKKRSKDDIDGQITFYSPDEKLFTTLVDGKHIAQISSMAKDDILYSIDFNNLNENVSITTQLTPYDQRCYLAIGALYKAGNKYITPTQIYYALGYDGTPGTKDLNDINESIAKMRAAHVYIDNKVESENSRYDRFVYDDSLLPAARVSVISRGKLTANAIMPHGEPPLIAFARQRKQITTIPRNILVSNLSKTDANLRLENYFIEAISHMKNGKRRKKMLFDTIYLQCNVTTPKQKKRTLEKMRKLLDGYSEKNWIKGYKEEQDGITIILSDKKSDENK